MSSEEYSPVSTPGSEENVPQMQHYSTTSSLLNTLKAESEPEISTRPDVTNADLYAAQYQQQLYYHPQHYQQWYNNYHQPNYWANYFPNGLTHQNPVDNFTANFPYFYNQVDAKHDVSTSDVAQAMPFQAELPQQPHLNHGPGSIHPASVTLKKPRVTFNSKQVVKLEQEFNRQSYLCRPKRASLAAELGLSEGQVKIWFQNRRMKAKKERNGATSRVN